MSGNTFEDGVQAAIHLLSTNITPSMGYCSAARLWPVAEPAQSWKIYVDYLAAHGEGEGDYQDGLAFAIGVLETKRLAPAPDVPNAWVLLPSDAPSVDNQLFISALQRMAGVNG